MGLQANDLKDLVYRIFEVDSYKSKMGEDKDIVVLSFSCMTEASARDLENFIEKGYPHVLDADVSSGEQSDGTYKVFVELERMKDVPKQIFEIVDGVKLLTGIPEMKFRYYKSFKSMPAEEGILGETIPLDKDSYEIKKDLALIVKKTELYENNQSILSPLNSDKYLFDLPLLIKESLKFSKINNFGDIDMNTYEKPELFFSHRKSTHDNFPKQAKTGRHISVIGLVD